MFIGHTCRGLLFAIARECGIFDFCERQSECFFKSGVEIRAPGCLGRDFLDKFPIEERAGGGARAKVAEVNG